MIREQSLVAVGAILFVVALSFALPAVLPARLRLRGAVMAPPLLLLLAAIGLVRDGGPPAGRVLLLDVSRSTGLDSPVPATFAVRAGLDLEGLRVIVFGRAAVPIVTDPTLPVAAVDIQRAGAYGSDLAAGIFAAASALPHGGRVVIATDGRVDVSAAVRAAAETAASGVRFDVVPLGRLRRGDARIASVRAPSRISGAGRAAVVVSVRSDPGDAVVVSLFVDGERVNERSMVVGQGGGASLRFALPPLREGFHSIEASVSRGAPDSEPGNDRLGSGLVVGSSRRAYLAGNVPAAAVPGFESRVFDPLSPVPPDGDLLVLANVPATRMANAGSDLAQFVARGGGLLVLGGDRSFGAGAYSGRPIEDCLPVESGIGGGRLRVTLLIDRSATMGEPFEGTGGESKLEAAKAAARSLLASLPAEATFALASFSGDVDTNAGPFDLASGSSRRDARRAVDAVGPARGGTALGPPLELASKANSAFAADRRLTILVTDGRLEAESPEGPVAAAAGLRRSGCRLAVLAVGVDADLGFLRELGGGKEPAVVRASGEVESAFLEALLSTEAEGTIRHGERAVLSGPGLAPPWRGELPPVGSYALTKPKVGAEVWFETAGGDPLVAGWRYGLGRAASVMTDPLGAWGADELLVAALADWAARPAASTGPRCEVSASPSGMAIHVWLPLEAAVLRGTLRTADGLDRPVVLTAVGAGQFRSTAANLPPGPARISLSLGGSVYSGGLSVPYTQDLEESGPDPRGLRQLSSAIETKPVEGGGRDLAWAPAMLALFVFLWERAMRLGGRRLEGRGSVGR